MAYESRFCPVCRVIEETGTQIDTLNGVIERLKQEIEDLETTIYNLERQVRNLEARRD